MKTHLSTRSTSRVMRGFTLIELMIVVAIIAIISAIAFPSYLDSVWKGKRGEAKAAILKAMQAEERYYSQSNTYIDPSTLAAANRGAFPAYSADSASNSAYVISYTRTGGAGLCPDNDFAKCVIVTATVAGNPDPRCGTTLQLDSVGNKLPVQSGATAVCWR